uniref:Uncharacterized protein n=1 Tax=Candidatus Kentrum sp. TC TaxID=2126339 RepID=A0A450YRA4_9GAMM|nr:MAG: hypothetical protein BECKTC1821E_GA0114239_103112 [Candidatus Kentron sp. TC]
MEPLARSRMEAFVPPMFRMALKRDVPPIFRLAANGLLEYRRRSGIERDLPQSGSGGAERIREENGSGGILCRNGALIVRAGHNGTDNQLSTAAAHLQSGHATGIGICRAVIECDIREVGIRLENQLGVAADATGRVSSPPVTVTFPLIIASPAIVACAAPPSPPATLDAAPPVTFTVSALKSPAAALA